MAMEGFRRLLINYFPAKLWAMERVGILGGGLSGLALANLLERRKFEVEVLEKSGECGGLCRSVRDGGWTFDRGGSHVIFSKDKEVLEFILSALKGNLEKRRRNTKVFYKGRLVKYPFEHGLSGLPLTENFECLAYYAGACVMRKLAVGRPRNFEEWLRRRFGRGIAEKYLIPYNEKIWNTPAREMGVEWVEGRIPQPPLLDVVRSSLGISTEGYTHQLQFYYPREGGIQALTDSLRRSARDEVVTGFDVKRVSREGDEWIVSDGKVERSYDKLVSTIPIHELARILDGLPSGIRKAVSRLRFNSLITVAVGVDAPKLNNISWMYFPKKKEGLFNRVSFPSNFSPHVAPAGKTLVLAEITAIEGDGIWRMKDGKIAESVVSDLHRNGILDEKKVSFTRLERSKHAYILHDLEWAKSSEEAREFFAAAGVHLVGRFAEFRYLNMDACVRSAMTKAGELNSRRF